MIYRLVTKVKNKSVEMKELESNQYAMETYANKVIDVAIKKHIKGTEVIISKKRKVGDEFVHHLTISC